MDKQIPDVVPPPLELVLKGGDPNKIALWGCGVCHLSAISRESALACCASYVCEGCGVTIKQSSYCHDCHRKEQAAKDQVTYDKATKVKYVEYDGQMLCCDHCDEYFWDLDSYLDSHQDEPEDIRTWAWGTYEVPLTLDAERILSDQLESQDFYEDAFNNIAPEALSEMQVFFDEWLKKRAMKSYMVDHSVVVDLEEGVAEYIKEQTDP